MPLFQDADPDSMVYTISRIDVAGLSRVVQEFIAECNPEVVTANLAFDFVSVSLRESQHQ